MSERRAGEPEAEIDLEVDLAEPPEKVWRAISIPAFRARWLPDADLAEPEPMSVTPGEEACFRLRDDAPPFLESTVTFTLAPNGSGGTRLRIVHALTDARILPATRQPANANAPPLMRAA